MPDIPLPPPVRDADLTEAIRLLTCIATRVEGDDPNTVGVVKQGLAEQIDVATDEQLGWAIRLWIDLVDATVTPVNAAALPTAPFRGPDGGRWHSGALAHLPTRVAMAGPDAVRAVLARDPHVATPGLPDIPDIRLSSGWLNRQGVDAIADAWVDRLTSNRQREHVRRSLDPLLEPRTRIAGFLGSAAMEEEWKVDATWSPMVALGMTDRDCELFGSVSSPLSFTARYPSSVVGAVSRMAGSTLGAGRRVATLRSIWRTQLEVIIESWTYQLGHDLHGLPGSPEDRRTLVVPTQRLSERPLEFVVLRPGSGLRQSAGLRIGGPRGGQGELPAAGRSWPTEDTASGSRTEQTDSTIRVTVDLPSRELPPLEDAVAGVMRVFAHRLLTDVDDLTPFARQVLQAWRDHGPGGWGSPSRTVAADVDEAVASVRNEGVELT